MKRKELFLKKKKKSKSVVSGNWPGEIFLSITHPTLIVEFLSEYIFLIKKKKKRRQKAKATKEEREYM